MNRAIFLDRDGVINPLIYHTDAGVLDSPFTPAHFSIIAGVPETLARLRQLGYLLILISNQPGLAKGHFTKKTFDAIRQKMDDQLAADGVVLDAQYYCLHHPQSTSPRYRVDCNCRKPKPGLLLQAAAEHQVDLAQSWLIGDSLTDVQAGQAAGVRTILIGKMKCEFCRLMDESCARPHHIIDSLSDAVAIVSNSAHPEPIICSAHPEPVEGELVEGSSEPVAISAHPERRSQSESNRSAHPDFAAISAHPEPVEGEPVEGEPVEGCPALVQGLREVYSK
jgi:D-glycero-D-manno-heptose 1,7-bisphosphate phosphatase